jgi:hypothetical protein
MTRAEELRDLNIQMARFIKEAESFFNTLLTGAHEVRAIVNAAIEGAATLSTMVSSIRTGLHAIELRKNEENNSNGDGPERDDVPSHDPKQSGN